MRALAFCLVLLAFPAAAQEPTVTRLSLMETASREVADDRYVAVLQARSEAAEAAAAQAALNRVMQEALAAVQDVAELHATTQGYRVDPRERDDTPTTWVAWQILRLETADRSLLLEHVATLQAMGLATQQLGSMLSRQGHDAHRDELVREALEGLRRQVDTVAATLGLTFEGFAEINLDGLRPMPMPRAMMAEARADAPVMTEGTSTVSVTVNATALLAP